MTDNKAYKLTADEEAYIRHGKGGARNIAPAALEYLLVGSSGTIYAAFFQFSDFYETVIGIRQMNTLDVFWRGARISVKEFRKMSKERAYEFFHKEKYPSIK